MKNIIIFFFLENKLKKTLISDKNYLIKLFLILSFEFLIILILFNIFIMRDLSVDQSSVLERWIMISCCIIIFRCLQEDLFYDNYYPTIFCFIYHQQQIWPVKTNLSWAID